MKLKGFLLTLMLIMISAAGAKAQVTIGMREEPSEGALLDLKEYPSNQSVTSTKGLGLPRVSLTDLTKLYPMFNDDYDPAENAKHVGLTVYNVQGCNASIPGGIYVWDGARWNDINAKPAPSGTVDIVVKVNASGNGTSNTNTPCRKVLRFMTHNLGALSYKEIAGPNATPGETAKAQMAHDTQGDKTDITVFGGLYQWGRKTDGHEKRNSSTITTQYGNPATTDNLFVTGSEDWLSTQTDNLWGNGLSIGSGGNGVDSGGNEVPLGKGSYDPCPPGYRVPTEHEWALLGNEGGSATSPSNDEISSITVSGKSGSSGIVWVPVSGGKASITWSSGATCGYALYDADVWAGAATGYKSGSDALTAAGAPDPLLFLPAAGFREYLNGDVDNTGSVGHYWSSLVNGSDSYRMRVGSGSVHASYNSLHRANGCSVRCIAE
jgi:hypothetical protein